MYSFRPYIIVCTVLLFILYMSSVDCVQGLKLLSGQLADIYIYILLKNN